MDRFVDKMAEGNAFARDHRFHEAEMAYREAIQINPNDPSAHFNLASMLSNQEENPEEVEREYREAIRLDPGFSQAYKYVGKLMIEQGRFSEAERELHLSVDRNRDDPETRYLLGIALDEQNKAAEAVDEYNIAIHHEPNNIDAHYRLGIVYGDLMQYKNAIREFREVLRLKPDNSSAWFFLVVALQDERLLPYEEDNLRGAVQAYPGDSAPLEALALFLDALNRRKEAREFWERALGVETRPYWIKHIKLRLKWMD
jgi:superkiller protein 3